MCHWWAASKPVCCIAGGSAGGISRWKQTNLLCWRQAAEVEIWKNGLVLGWKVELQHIWWHVEQQKNAEGPSCCLTDHGNRLATNQRLAQSQPGTFST